MSNCTSLRLSSKGRQEEVKCTFDTSKCERIFYELLKLGYLKISHNIPPVDEIRRKPYCKFHNSFSHHTNDCNYFHKHIQAAIDDVRLTFHEMGVDKRSFPAAVNTMNLQQTSAKVLLRPNQTDNAKGKNVVVGEEKADLRDKRLKHEVSCETAPDGRVNLKITLNPSGTGGTHRTLMDRSVARRHSRSWRKGRPVVAV